MLVLAQLALNIFVFWAEFIIFPISSYDKKLYWLSVILYVFTVASGDIGPDATWATLVPCQVSSPASRIAMVEPWPVKPRANEYARRISSYWAVLRI